MPADKMGDRGTARVIDGYEESSGRMGQEIPVPELPQNGYLLSLRGAISNGGDETATPAAAAPTPATPAPRVGGDGVGRRQAGYNGSWVGRSLRNPFLAYRARKG